MKENRDNNLHNQEDKVQQTTAHQISSPDNKETNLSKEQQKPFVNDYGVVIGDNFYDSPNSPLNNWSKDVDPAIMAGDQWVHPTNDIGWNTPDNKALREKGYLPGKAQFMHPDKDVSYRKD